MANSIQDIQIKTINGKPAKLGDYKGKALLIVNVASKCGLTPQYDGLERLYEKYREQGLEVLGFPANEFAGQEPGSNEEIAEFCRLNYGVKFPMFEKIVVKGPGQHPLYKELTAAKPAPKTKPGSKITPKPTGEINWNFEKFLVNRKGEVIERFAPDIAPEDPMIVSAIEAALKN
ncbi:MAG TPA: glutathione peroxidase [Bdellovibrionales bacterium]|nr:glutathione peroxidase [Bdellovibrionales bacterium]